MHVPVSGDAARSTPAGRTAFEISYQPIADVARALPAGYQVDGHPAEHRSASLRRTDPGAADPDTVAALVLGSLDTFATLPPNTFLSIPLPVSVAAAPAVRDALLSRGQLAGAVLDVIGSAAAAADAESFAQTLERYREAGALLAVGGHGAPQPALTSIVRLRPAIIRLGREWIHGIAESAAKRSAVETIGNLAGQLDAWVLAEGVASAAELRALAGLDVPLAQGPFIGTARPFCADIEAAARTALPSAAPIAPATPATASPSALPFAAPPTSGGTASDGALRSLIQPAYTTTDAAAAGSVLPDTTGFDVVVELDVAGRPVRLLVLDAAGSWAVADVLAVNVATPVADAAARAMLRPKASRFTPLACTDDRGAFVGIVRMERLMGRLTR